MSISDALATVVSGDTLVLLDGVYTLDTMAITGGVTVLANSGARPVIAGSDGTPVVTLGDGVYMSGVWFGGTRKETESGSVNMGSNCIVEDCVLFNGHDGMFLDNLGCVIRRVKFIDCGKDALWHPLYVRSTDNLVEECIVVGGEGYGLHLYHEPARSLAKYNFVGNVHQGLALQGDNSGPVSGDRNIIWTVSATPLYNVTSLGTCNNNVWQGCSQPQVPDADNYFVDPVPTSGTNPVVWQEADVVTNLGNSSANIDAAIAALETAFAQTVQQIHDDATIETHFATLKSVIDTWKLQ